MTRMSRVIVALIVATTIAVVVNGARHSSGENQQQPYVNRWAQVERQYAHLHDNARSVRLVSPPVASSNGLSTLSLESMGLPAVNFLHTESDVDAGEWIVTVKSPISDSYRQLLTSSIAAIGGRLTNYLPHDSFLVAGRGHNNDAFVTSLYEVNGVRDVQPYTAVSKISPSLDMKPAAAPSMSVASVDTAADTTPASAAAAAVDETVVHKLRVHVSSHGVATSSMAASWKRGMIRDGIMTITDTVTLLNDRYIDINVANTYVPSVQWLASRHDVHFIESRNQPFEIQNKFAQAVIQDNNKWSNTTSLLWLHGVTGEGQVVSMGDTGIDYDSCFFRDANLAVPVGNSLDAVNLNHRKIVLYVPLGDASDAALGHGTHVAGSVAGEVVTTKTDAYQALHPYNGMAYKAKLAFWDFKKDTGAELLVPDDLYNDYYLPAQKWTGAAISSNSWGAPDGTYSSYCVDTDRYVNEHQDFLPVFAAGNYGEKGLFSISSPGVSKNILTVGASMNNAASFFDLGQAVGFKVIAPAASAGTFQVVPAGFGPPYHKLELPADNIVVISNPADACSTILNAADMSGMVVVVVRGTCKFAEKAQRIAAAGAKLVLVANNEPGAAIIMGSEGITVTIAAGMITQQDWKFVNMSAVGQRIHIQAPVGFDAPDLNEANMASFSSRGPAMDGRIKPDIVAPGLLVTSSRSDGNIQSLQCDTTDLLPMQGTSMATPVTAGGVALVRQYYMNGFYPTGIANATNSLVPSAALMKATVISSGTSVGGEVRTTSGSVTTQTVEPAPSKYQGFGRVYLSRALPFADVMECDRPSLYVADYQPISTGQVATYCFSARPVMNHPYPLRATLVWSDPAGDVGSSTNLINNLDLFVINNDTQQVIFGNTHSFTDIDGEHWPADEVNNVEQVTIDSVVRNTLFTVHVRGTNVPVGPQNFSLVVNGFFTQLPLEQCNSAVLCPNSCSNQGTCNRTTGVCVCATGRAGVDCSQVVVTLTKSSSITEIIRTQTNVAVPVGAWEYFEYTVADWMIANSTIAGHTITMTRTDGAGDPDMYITVNGEYPNFANWDYLSTACDSCPPPIKPSTVAIPRAKLIEGTVIRVGIYGYCCTSSSVAIVVTGTKATPVPDEKKPTPTGIVVVAAIGVTLAIFALGFAVVYIRRRRAATNSQGYELTGRPTTGNVVNATDGTSGFVPL